MRFRWRCLAMRFNRLFALSLALLLAACATQPKGRLPSTPAVPGVKIGAPYEVFGVRYVPADDRSYDRHGIASWYGPTFHAKPTANGEIYNQEDMTAAHKTLPMPSWVEVTNLDNGKQLVVRINDRGPFVDGRIIDLSRRSAELLGVERAGLARVRVKRVFPEGDWARGEPPRAAPVQLASATRGTGGAPTPVMPSAPPLVPTPVAPPVAAPVPPLAPVVSAGSFVQVAALSDEGRAKALASVLADFGPAFAAPTTAGLWRVRIGPLTDVQTANTLYEVRMAGYQDAILVREGGQ